MTLNDCENVTPVMFYHLGFPVSIQSRVEINHGSDPQRVRTLLLSQWRRHWGVCWPTLTRWAMWGKLGGGKENQTLVCCVVLVARFPSPEACSHFVLFHYFVIEISQNFNGNCQVSIWGSICVFTFKNLILSIVVL